MSVVDTNPPQIMRDLTTVVARYSVATVHEAQGRKGLPQFHMRPIYPEAYAVSTAVTASEPPADNSTIHIAVEQCRERGILVVAPTSTSDTGCFGELLACSLAVRRADAEQILRVSVAHERKAAAIRARLKAAELGLDVYGMREAPAKRGAALRGSLR